MDWNEIDEDMGGWWLLENKAWISADSERLEEMNSRLKLGILIFLVFWIFILNLDRFLH